MIEAKTKIVPSNSEASSPEYFVIGNEITPVREASASYIINTDFSEQQQIVPETQVKRLVVQNKETNPLNKFFNRTSSYLDSLQSFLGQLVESYKLAISQKKSIYASEESEQKVRTQRSKRTFRRLSKSARSRTSGATGLDDTSLLLAVATAYGLDLADTAVTSVTNLFTNKKVFKDIAGKRDYTMGQGQNLGSRPAWIPFPKGTKGLVFTSGYGQRTMGGVSRLHSGIDIAGAVGTPIITPITGVITRSNVVSGYGKMVTVRAGEIEMDFAHLDSMTVEIDDQVKAGTKIGELGNTGRSSGPHLHWNVLMNGNMVDPAQWTRDNQPDMESEGGINLSKIMVGEAGAEFVVPMSQMQIFADLMMKEKIKSILPEYYIAKSLTDLGVKRQSGFSNIMMGEGGIAKGIEWIKEEEGISSLIPGKNKYVKPSWPEWKNVTDSTVFHAYETGVANDRTTIGWGFTFLDEITKGNRAVFPGMTMTKKEADELLEYQVRDYHDNYLDTKYFPKFKYFTPKQQAGVILYGFNQPYFWKSAPAFSKAIEDGNLREASEQVGRGLPTREKIERMLLRSGPLQIVGPGIVGEKKVGPGKVGAGMPFIPDLTIDKFFNPGKYGDQSSLNSIPDSNQMAIASETQEEFSFGNSKSSIVALFKPTVHYQEA